MAEIKPFTPVKLVCGIIASRDDVFQTAEAKLVMLYGTVDSKSLLVPFDLTDYYEKQMGENLKRCFLSFSSLISPEKLSGIKIQTNLLEEEIRTEKNAPRRVVNIDPGFITGSALIMATAKDFSHRIPLQLGVYGHLEFLFTKDGIKFLEWTYPDIRMDIYRHYFLEIRKIYLDQMRALKKKDGGFQEF